MSKTLRRIDLDQLRCAAGCDGHPIVLHSVCHPRAATWAAYDRESGNLTITCCLCKREIAVIAVECA